MKRLLLTAVLLAALGAPARADVADGLGAYWRGHYVAALREFQPLARAGDAAAQFYLGEMYEDGRGVPQNDAEAAKWYRKSAEQGDATAQFNLGFIYGEGEGVPQDYVQAHMWSNLAAAQGNELARKSRDIDEKRMTPAQVADAQRLARAWRPKKAGPSIASRGGNSNITPAPRSGGFKALLPTPPNRSAPTTPSRELVARIQESLASLGYDPGSVDGIPGAKTRVAISPDFSNPLMHRGGESRKMAIRQSLTAIPERPRCKQSVAQHCSNLNRLNGTRLWPGSMAESSHRMPEGCCWGGWIAASG